MEIVPLLSLGHQSPDQDRGECREEKVEGETIVRFKAEDTARDAEQGSC